MVSHYWPQTDLEYCIVKILIRIFYMHKQCMFLPPQQRIWLFLHFKTWSGFQDCDNLPSSIRNLGGGSWHTNVPGVTKLPPPPSEPCTPTFICSQWAKISSGSLLAIRSFLIKYYGDTEPNITKLNSFIAEHKPGHISANKSKFK